MSIQKAPGSTVLRQITNGMSLLNIEVDTDWAHKDIIALAVEEGFAYVPATGRFRRRGIVDAAPETDTGASSAAVDAPPTSDEHTVAPVSGPIDISPGASIEIVPEPPRVTLDPAPVISAGLAHPDPGIRATAETARDTIATLATALVEWEQRGEALAEVARLEEELAAARIRAGLARPPRPPVNPEAKRIRAWAAENGVPCTRTGIVPKAVVEAYIAAHEGIAS